MVYILFSKNNFSLGNEKLPCQFRWNMLLKSCNQKLTHKSNVSGKIAAKALHFWSSPFLLLHNPENHLSGLLCNPIMVYNLSPETVGLPLCCQDVWWFRDLSYSADLHASDKSMILKWVVDIKKMKTSFLFLDNLHDNRKPHECIRMHTLRWHKK